MIKNQIVTHDTRIYDGVNACTSITIHETDNPRIGANAQAHANLQTDGTVRQASWHIQVDDTEAIRSYPNIAQCWHAGTDEGNRTSVAIEICVNADGDYDKAFARAAEVAAEIRVELSLGRDAVVQHNTWTGKNCPSQMRLTGRWQEFLDLTEPKENKPMSKMVSPFEGRLTQHHGDTGGYRGHKGMDIAPPSPGQTGKPVYAAFAGTVKRTYTSSRPGNLRSTWAPGRTGNGVLIANPDGEGNGYNHIMPCVRAGQKVKAGQLIGHNDRSGNQTGPHLHFELWGNWRNSNSDYPPSWAFNKFGIRPGSAPSHTTTAESVKPKPSKPAKTSKATRANRAIQKALNYMDIDVGKEDGVNGKWQKAGVKVFQKANGLVEDGYWGEKTQAVYEQNKRIQKALKKMGIYSGRKDGNNGRMQKASVKKFQKAHGLVEDGDWGPKTQAVFDQVKAVQRALKKKGYTKQTVDGYQGNQTTTNLKDFQRRAGLKQDAIAGPITRKHLGL